MATCDWLRWRRDSFVGLLGELYVVAVYFLLMGHSIVEWRARRRCGEIDIVARQGETLVFVEVKTRLWSSVGDVEWVVSGKQRRRIMKAAHLFRDRSGLRDCGVRFDIAYVNRIFGLPHIVRDVWHDDRRGC